MPRRKRGGSAPRSQGMKDAQSLVRDAQKRAREILKKSGRNVRDVRRDVKALQKAGLASSRLDTQKYLPTRYMLSKIKRNADIIAGKAVAIKAPKDVREKYVEKGVFEERQGRLIVPKDFANQETQIKRGLVETTRRLANGQERRVYLPFKAIDLQDVAMRLRDDPTLDGLKNPDEMFGFRLFGHNMGTFGFPDAEMLGEYILTRYAHLFKGSNRREAMAHFQLIRFKGNGSQLPEGPAEEKIYSPYKRTKPVKDFIYQKRLKKDAARKRRERAQESTIEHQRRIDAQRLRTARNRQRKFNDE